MFVCLTCLVYLYLELRWGWPRGTISAAWHCMLLKHNYMHIFGQQHIVNRKVLRLAQGGTS